jgi:transposase InsO family protein
MLDIVDNCTLRGWCIPVANKSHALKALIAWQLAIEARTGDRVKAYNIDNGELKSTKFETFCASHGIEIRCMSAGTSAQNGKVECYHLTIETVHFLYD